LRALLRRAVREAGGIPPERALRTGWLRQGEGPTGDILARHTVDRLGRVRECQRRERDQVAVDLKRVQVNVLESVAGLVVARIELLAGGAAPDLLLLIGLDLQRQNSVSSYGSPIAV
jgi:hypothetical protein